MRRDDTSTKRRIDRSLWVLPAVAVAAYAAGRLGLPVAATAPALAAPAQDPAQDAGAAQQEAWARAGTPGAHHEHLKQLAGDWEATWRIWMDPAAPPIESTGTISREWVLDGHYLGETVDASSDWGRFKGIGYLGFNNMDGRYELVWMDSMSTTIVHVTGSYDAKAGVMTLRGSHRDPVTGHVLATRSVLDMSDPKRHLSTEYVTGADGRERKLMEGVAERR